MPGSTADWINEPIFGSMGDAFVNRGAADRVPDGSSPTVRMSLPILTISIALRTLRAAALLTMAVAALSPATPADAREQSSCRDTSAAMRMADTTLGRELHDRAYLSIERRIEEARYADAAERALLIGVLASHRNRHAEAIHLLEPLSDASSAPTPELRSAVHAAIAQSYEKSFQYRHAGEIYARIAADSTSGTVAERASAAESGAVMALLGNASPQRVHVPSRMRLSSRRNRLRLIEVPVSIGDNRTGWIFDTGAAISTITESFAKRLGCHLLGGTASARGISGQIVPLRVATIASLHLGPAVIQNVAVLVVPDSTLYISQLGFQINGILGYPVIAALGEVTLHHDGRVLVRHGAAAARVATAALYMEGTKPLIAVEEGGRKDLYQFDSGADVSMLTLRFCVEHDVELRTHQQRAHGIAGAGGSRSLGTYVLPAVTLSVGGRQATLANVTELDVTFGKLGQDLIMGAESYSIDFSHMRCALHGSNGGGLCGTR